MSENQGTLSSITLEPGDVIVFTVNSNFSMTVEAHDKIKTDLERRFPGHSVIIVMGGTLGTIKNQGDGSTP